MAKIAVSGKGGVGKTTVSSLLAYLLVSRGHKVYAIDADPNPTLGHALGFPKEKRDQVVPLIAMADLIEERTGARPGDYGGFFRMNPRVDDIPARFAIEHRGIYLMQMGSVRGAGTGCVCPENTMVKALVTHLMLRETESVLMDMVAGMEHLGRGTAQGVDAMYLVVEPGQRSVVIAQEMAVLAQDLRIKQISVIANKIRRPGDLEFIRANLPQELNISGSLPYDERFVEADMLGSAITDVAPDIALLFEAIYDASHLI